MPYVLFASPKGKAQSLWFNHVKREWTHKRTLGCVFQSVRDADEAAPLARDLLNPYDLIEIREAGGNGNP